MPAIVMPSITTKGSPSMIMRSAKVPLSPSSALQTMYFWSAAACATVFHLIPVGKPGAATAAQAGSRDIGEDGIRGKRQRALKSLVAAMGTVIPDRTRVDHAATREGQAGLPLEPGNLLGDAKPQGMRTVSDHGLEHGSSIGRCHRAVRDTSLRRRDFDHRFQPVQAARSG